MTKALASVSMGWLEAVGFRTSHGPRRALTDDTRIVNQILAYLMAEGVALSEDSTPLEEVVLTEIRRIGARVIEEHLVSRRLAYVGAWRPCRCGRRQRFVEYRPKTVATLLGRVRIRRACYRCGVCGTGSLPYEAQVGFDDGPESVGLAKPASLLGIQEPF